MDEPHVRRRIDLIRGAGLPRGRRERGEAPPIRRRVGRARDEHVLVLRGDVLRQLSAVTACNGPSALRDAQYSSASSVTAHITPPDRAHDTTGLHHDGHRSAVGEDLRVVDGIGRPQHEIGPLANLDSAHVGTDPQDRAFSRVADTSAAIGDRTCAGSASSRPRPSWCGPMRSDQLPSRTLPAVPTGVCAVQERASAARRMAAHLQLPTHRARPRGVRPYRGCATAP
jgi:hypothetical protein